MEKKEKIKDREDKGIVDRTKNMKIMDRTKNIVKIKLMNNLKVMEKVQLDQIRHISSMERMQKAKVHHSKDRVKV